MNKTKINYIHDALPKFLRERGFEVERASGKAKDRNIKVIHVQRSSKSNSKWGEQ